MQQQIPKALTVLVDDREKYPVQFPANFRWHNASHAYLIKVHTKRVRLPTGDYALKGYEKYVLVERKGSMRELHNNLCTKDVVRFTACLHRMRKECARPILYVDLPLATVFRAGEYVPNPEMVVDKFFQRAVEFETWPLWVSTPKTLGGAQRAGELLIRTMWTAVYQLLQHPPKETPNGQ